MGGKIVSRRRLLAAGLGVTFLLAGCATAPKKTAEVHKLQARAAYERGVAHVRDRQAGPALTALQEAASIDPTSGLYRDTLGLVYLDLARPDVAIEHFQKAIELDPNYADAHFHLGTALAEMRRWEEAVASYRRAIALPTLTIPDFAHQNLGLALYHLRRYREAEQALRFAISLEPEMQAAYYNLGLVFVAESRADDAKAAFRRARQLGPDSPFGQAAAQRLQALGEGG
jgi:type IV pilus assembly protein PilF